MKELRNLDVFFRSWFKSRQQFHRILASSEAVVSGTLVVHFFERIDDPLDSMEVFVRYSKSSFMREYLEGNGYIVYVDDGWSDCKGCERTNVLNSSGKMVVYVRNNVATLFLWKVRLSLVEIDLVGFWLSDYRLSE